MVIYVLQRRDGTAGVKVSDVGLRVEVLLCDVAVVRCFHPVPDTCQHDLCAQDDRCAAYGSSIITCPSAVQQVSSTSVFSGRYAITSHVLPGHILHSVLYLSVASSMVRFCSSESGPQYSRSSVTRNTVSRGTCHQKKNLTFASILK
jgi:hypothetical protein